MKQPPAARTAQGTSCLRCGGVLEFRERLLVGETLRCEACGTHLEVAEIDPVRLELYHRIDEDSAADAGEASRTPEG